MQLRRRETDLWLHVGLFSLYLGTFSVFGFVRRIEPSLGSMGQMGLVMLTWLLVLYAVWRSRRLPMYGVVLLALLPYAHMAWFTAMGESTSGAFSYLYKFSGFLIAPYLWLWARSRDEAQIERTLMVLATVAAVRAVLTFAVPGLAPGAGKFVDDFIVYEWVGPLPRIFYPGMALVFLGLTVSLRNIFQTTDRALPLEVARALLFLTAMCVNMSRGMLILAVLVTTLLVIVKFSSGAVAAGLKGRLVLGTLLALSGAALVVVATPLADTLGSAIAGQGAQERFSLDQKNLDWRAQQVSAAFRLVQTPEAQWLGVGTNTFIPESLENPRLGEVTNELHYSYDSVRWTFGTLGLLLLIAFTMAQPLARFTVLRPATPLVLPTLLTGAFISLAGLYTVVFTTSDWSFMLALCGAYLHARCDARRALPASARARRAVPALNGPARRFPA